MKAIQIGQLLLVDRNWWIQRRRWNWHMLTEVCHAIAFQCIEGGYILDNCGVQNKNIQTVAVCLYAVNRIAHINEIQYTFQEAVYTHTECDGMHATIEHAKKYAKVHSIGQWKVVLAMARRNSQYNITRLRYADFYDLKALTTATISNNYVDNDGQPVNWRKAPSLCF